MQWIFGAMAVLALAIAFIDLMIGWLRHDDLTHRVNIIDEVTTVHSEEIDELQRGRKANAKRVETAIDDPRFEILAERISDIEQRMMSASWEQAVERVQELEAQSGKECKIIRN